MRPIARRGRTAAQPPAGLPNGGAFATGRYRHLFREAGHPDAAVRAKIEAAYQQLCHGDSATQTVFYWAGTNPTGRLGYLTDVANHDVRSEGMSYGMMIAVQLDHRAEFDALWNWAMTYMYHDDLAHPACRFVSWSMKPDGTPNSESPAPDGEEYWAIALYFASARWGDGQGIYDYHAMADRLLSAMKNRGEIAGPWKSRPDRTERDGAEVNVEHTMVRFTPDLRRPDHTDPSYHLPAFYELWARWGPVADRPFWREAARVSRDFLDRTTDAATALAPEYANFDGTPVARRFNRWAGTFGPDAWRTAANWSVDWAWWGADPRERARSDRIQAFFASKGIDAYGGRWRLDGTRGLDSVQRRRSSRRRGRRRSRRGGSATTTGCGTAWGCSTVGASTGSGRRGGRGRGDVVHEVAAAAGTAPVPPYVCLAEMSYLSGMSRTGANGALVEIACRAVRGAGAAAR